MDSCVVNSLDKHFGPERAQQDVEAYTRNGLEPLDQHLVQFLKEKDLSGQTLLDIGCGTGALLLELLKAGAEKAMGVDASPAYIQAARELTKKLGHQGRVQYRIMDFAQQPETLEQADVVLLQRVICCYPKMKELVVPAAEHARRFLALSYPRDTSWTRREYSSDDTQSKTPGNKFREFLHSPAQITKTVLGQRFTLIHHRLYGTWHLSVFRRE